MVALITTVLGWMTRFWRSVRCTMLGVVPCSHFDRDCVGLSDDAANNNVFTGAKLNVVPLLVSVEKECFNESLEPSTDSCLWCISKREIPESND